MEIPEQFWNFRENQQIIMWIPIVISRLSRISEKTHEILRFFLKIEMWFCIFAANFQRIFDFFEDSENLECRLLNKPTAGSFL